MRKLLATAILISSFSASADSFTTPDKALHFGGSAIAGAIAGSMYPDNQLKAWGLAMAPGVIKELYDARRGGSGFSGKDLVADALGAYAGVKFGVYLSRRGVFISIPLK